MAEDRTALMSAKALSPGYEVLWYTIDKVLGQGGFGITYLAHDRNLDRAVAIKEYLPTSFAYRQENDSVKPITGDHRENFAWGLGSFLKEAQTLARFSHRNIVRVHSVFEENNTAYMVMEYEHGQNLARIYKQGTQQDQAFYERIFFPIMDGLSQIHQFDFIHRDIKPANIYIREDGTPVLIDFGSARQTTQQQTGEMTTLVSQGYTPLEQYSANYGDQGPWTDIYALAATLYEGITGRKPDEALSQSACMMRHRPDAVIPLEASAYPGFSQAFLDAVFAGLKLEPEGRPQTLEAWRALFDQGPVSAGQRAGGFTALDDDRTRIRPRAPVPGPEPVNDDPGFDSFTDLDEATTDRATQRSSVPRSTTRHPALDDAVPAFPDEPGAAGDDRLSNRDAGITSSTLAAEWDEPMPTGRRHPAREQATTAAPAAGKGRAGVLVGFAVLLLAVAGASWWFLTQPTGVTRLNAAALSQLAPPKQPASIQLPQEAVLAQLDNMVSLAPLLTRAYRLAPADTVLLDTIRATDASLMSMAQRWNASQYLEVASRIRAVSDALPATIHDADRLESILSARPGADSYDRVLALVEQQRYLKPAGDSVLDKVTALGTDEYQRLRETQAWQQMMARFSSRALDSVSQARYEEAARLTEAALTLDGANEDFLALRRFLEDA